MKERQNVILSMMLLDTSYATTSFRCNKITSFVIFKIF